MNKKNNRRFTALVILSLAVIQTQSAFAASLNVKIRQSDRAGEAKTVTCQLVQKCELSFSVKTEKANETVTAHIDYSPRTLVIEFQTARGYLYTGDRKPADPETNLYHTLWNKPLDTSKASIFNVTLFLPAVERSIGVPFLERVQEPVADLEITAEAGP